MIKRDADGIIQREMPEASIRSVDSDKRTAELSFSSEEPYTRYGVKEILDHGPGACDLKRLRSIGCVLFNHNKDKVIGKILSADIKDGRGVATVQFDDDETSQEIFDKVKSGTLKGVSVGYIVSNWEYVDAGAKSTDKRFEGECEIARKWTPLEISIVSIPADPTVGVGRSYSAGNSLETRERHIQLNKNISRRYER